MNQRKEVKKRWGDTSAYKEYEERSLLKTKADEEAASKGLMNIFAEIGAIKDKPENDTAVLKMIKKLQDYITKNYYTCSDEMLKNLGDLYVTDKRFKENIDAAGGAGTALFVKKAIDSFLGKN